MDELTRQVYADYVETHSGYARTASYGLPRGAMKTLRRFIKAHLPNDRESRILEVGCGAGDLLAEMRAAGYEKASGIDVSPPQVALATARGLPVQLGEAVEHLQRLRPDSLDMILAYDALEHLPRDSLYAFVTAAHRALATGGILLVRTPNGASPFGARSRYYDITHFHAFTANSLQQLFLGAGFARVGVHEEAPVAHGLISFLRLLVWHACASFFRLFIAAETGELRGHIMSLNLVARAVK